MKTRNSWLIHIVFSLAVLILIFLLPACSTGPEATAPPPEPPQAEVEPTDVLPTSPPPTDVPPPTLPPPTSTVEPTSIPATPTLEPTEELVLDPLPADSQEIEFQADDGQILQGTYYPAAVNPAPMIVLMHWAPGDQYDWNEIAPWLQNRGLGGSSPNPGGVPWLDSSWFPPMLEGQSFGVFTFTFRNCEGGCSSFEPAGWLLDAQAAMKTARELDGVDKTMLVAIGASIGADGAPDGCFWINDQHENSCLGVLSLSPGDYLTVLYKDAVDALGEEQPVKPDWCLYAVGDTDSADACKSASGDHYQLFEYPGDLHGMRLIDPNVEPNALLKILDFLNKVLGN